MVLSRLRLGRNQTAGEMKVTLKAICHKSVWGHHVNLCGKGGPGRPGGFPFEAAFCHHVGGHWSSSKGPTTVFITAGGGDLPQRPVLGFQGSEQDVGLVKVPGTAKVRSRQFEVDTSFQPRFAGSALERHCRLQGRGRAKQTTLGWTKIVSRHWICPHWHRTSKSLCSQPPCLPLRSSYERSRRKESLVFVTENFYPNEFVYFLKKLFAWLDQSKFKQF
jgi:hypothetical protein